MPAPSAKTSNEERLATLEVSVTELCRRFGNFEDRMDKFMDDLKNDLKTYSQAYNVQQTICAARAVTLKQVEERSTKLETRLEKLEGVYPAIKVFIWVGAAFGLSIIALIWSLITGQAQILLK